MEAAHLPAHDHAALRRPEFGHGLRAALKLVQDAEGDRSKPVEPHFALSEACPSEPVSPELVLVCPELREQALTALPDRDPDGFLPSRSFVQPSASVEDADDRTEHPPHARSRGRPIVAAAAYLAVEAAHVAVYGAVVMGALAGLITLATQIAGG